LRLRRRDGVKMLSDRYRLNLMSLKFGNNPPPFFWVEADGSSYNEALVLLGEKSERVEELQMDIVDLKEGYQHALQRLVGAK
jgi:hypothetical protein